jgi:general nucleoside transport system permease protein
MKGLLREALVPLLSVLLALAIGALVIVLTGRDPVLALRALWRGSFGDAWAVADTLSRSTPIILTGLSVALAFRCGLFNVGAEGQLYVGAMAAAVAGWKLAPWGVWAQAVALLAAAAAGGVWGAIPGWLKARFGVHEVINTIMLNFISFSLTSYLVLGPFKRPGAIPKTPDLPPDVRFTPLIQGARVSSGLLLALIAAAAIWFLLWRTVRGYEIRAVGHNPAAAEAAGIRVSGNVIYAMALAGLLAGLAGAERVLGLHGAFIHGFSPGYGFEGIAVGLLGRSHPLGLIPAALIFGMLSTGGLYMEMAAGVPKDLVTVSEALIVFLVGADAIIRRLLFRRAAEV